VGVAWLVQQRVPFHSGSTWPAFVAVFGLYLLVVGLLPDGSDGEWLSILGAMIGMAGLVALFQVQVHLHVPLDAYQPKRTVPNQPWEVWIYAWPLVFPTAFGLALVARSGVHRRDRMGRPALAVVIGLAMFVGAGLICETILHLGHYRATQHLGATLPIMLIVVGAVIGGYVLILLLHRQATASS